MHNINDRPVKYTKHLAFIPEKNIQGFFPTIPNNGSKGVCVFVHVCAREGEWERWDECVCGKEVFGVGYSFLAI